MLVGWQDGWETLNLKNAGIDRTVGPTTEPWMVKRVQISVTMAPSATQATETGLAQVLINAWLTNVYPEFGPQQMPYDAPTNTDWGSAAIVNTNGFASEAQAPLGANSAQANAANPTIVFPLFSKIMKARIEECDEYDYAVDFADGDLIMPEDSALVLHADHTDWPNDMGNAADLEWQYTVWYKPVS